jgi:hypothetical protein
MSFSIEHRISVALYFAGKEFPFDRINSLDFLHMSCSARLKIPMVHIKVADPQEFLSDSKALYDGSTIQVILSDGLTKARGYQFRLNTFVRNDGGNGVTYDIDGYLDFPKYWLESAYTALNDTSSGALKTILKICGINNVQTITTADKQLWLSGNRKHAEFIKGIVQCGYRGDSSYMVSSFDLNTRFRYLDAMDLANQTYLHPATFATPQKDSVLFTDFKPRVSSGVGNAMEIYKSTLIEQDIYQEAAIPTTHTSITLPATIKTPEINNVVKTALRQSRVKLAPIDIGNSHPKSERARYQNARLGKLFSVGMELLTPTVTGIELLDRISLTLDMDGASKYLKSYSGEYVVVSRAIYVNSNTYYEKFETTRPSAGFVTPTSTTQ